MLLLIFLVHQFFNNPPFPPPFSLKHKRDECLDLEERNIHALRKLDTGGDPWKDKDDFIMFHTSVIYIPVLTVSPSRE